MYPKTMKLNRRGFTIVELLIVIVVISILSAVAVVAFNGVQDKAYSSKVISAVDTYSKALKMYHIQNGRFPSYGTTWGACLGGAAQYPATALFPAGACTRHTSPSGTVSYDYASDSFNNEMKTILTTMPDVSLKEATSSGGSGYTTVYRGIYYEHQNNQPGASYPDWAYMEYVVAGNVPCPQDYATWYDDTDNVTFCSTLVRAQDTGID